MEADPGSVNMKHSNRSKLPVVVAGLLCLLATVSALQFGSLHELRNICHPLPANPHAFCLGSVEVKGDPLISLKLG